MKYIQGMLEMVKKDKLEMDPKLKYTWIWHMSNTMTVNDNGMYQIYEIYKET